MIIHEHSTRSSIYLILGMILCFQMANFALETITLQGRVENEKKQGLANIRIQVTIQDLQMTNKANKPALKEIFVTYTDKLGIYILKFPRTSRIQLLASGRASKCFVTTIDTVNSPDESQLKMNITLQEGLADIPLGSLDHAQIHVSIIHQQTIDRYIGAGQIEKIEPYLKVIISDKKQQKWAYRLAGHILFAKGLTQEAGRFFTLGDCQLQGNLMGDQAAQDGHYEQALDWYRHSENNPTRAENLLKMAENFQASGDAQRSEECYRLALSDYDRILNSFLFPWSSNNIDNFYVCLKKQKDYLTDNPIENPEIGRLIKLAQNYCRQLNNRSIYYFCKEAKTDRVGTNRILFRAETDPFRYFNNDPPSDLRLRLVTVNELFDLQFVQLEDGTLKEERKQVSEQIEDRNQETPLQSYSIIKPLYGPNTLIGKEWQSLFHYRIVGQEALFGEETAIIQAIPKWFNVENLSAGKLWINKRDGSVLKIEWSNNMVQNRAELRKRGLILDLEPKLTFISEYGHKKNGFWYPSRNLLRESYQEKDQEMLVRLEIESRYFEYQFFGVGSEYSIEGID